MEGINNLYDEAGFTAAAPMYGSMPNPNNCNNNRCSAAPITSSGEDYYSHMLREKLELDRFITHHNENVRLETESLRTRFSRRIISAVAESMTMKMKAKDEELQKISKLNRALEERVKSLSLENQIWRDIAQTSETTANALRNNLEQLLAIDEDVQSFCGNNYDEEEVEKRMLAGINGVDGSGRYYGRKNSRVCRSCGKEEACVLLLPCRHLCLCAVCGASVHICPMCNSTQNCRLLVNMHS